VLSFSYFSTPPQGSFQQAGFQESHILMKKAAALGLAVATAAAFAALTPLHATVYVPLVDGPLGAVRYRTSVIVTNPDSVPYRLTTTFLSAGSAQAGSAVTVAAHGAFVLSGLARSGERGLLAIDGPPRLLVSARLAATDAAGKPLSGAAVPIVADASLVPAGQVIHLQGLERTGGTVSRLGLVTLGTSLGKTAGTCQVAAFRTDGSPLGAAVQVRVPALGGSTVEAPLPVAAGRVAEARLEVTCDVPAFAWATVLSRDGSRTASAIPPSLLGTTTLEASLVDKSRSEGDDGAGGDRGPGGQPGGNGNGGGEGGGTDGGTGGGDTPDTPAGTPKPDANGSFSLPGTFLDARAGDSYRAYELALRPNARYKRLTVEFDLFLNRWQTPLFHAVSGLRRADKTLYYGIILRADRAKTILDLGRGQLAKDDGGLWQEGTTYHLRTTYDVQTRKVTFEVFRGGAKVAVVTGAMTSTDLRQTKSKVRIDFGIARIADGAYFPPIGWRYSNLEVTAVPF
jgi:hypothetical protein